MNNRIKNIQPEIAFVIICLIFGIGFLLATPIFQVPDETDHLLKSIHISKGELMPEKSLVFVSSYPPVPYIASSSILFVGRLVNFHSLDIVYFARLANLLLYILIVYAAIKLTPVHKWVFFLMALMPMTLYEASSLSADSFTIAISFLLISAFLNFSFDEEKNQLNTQDILFLFFLGLMVALSKQIYIVLMLLFFSIPLYKFENRRHMFSLFLVISIPLLLIIGGWGFLIQGAYVPILPEISFHGQIFFMILHPIAFIQALLHSFLYYAQYYLVSFVGTFGWLDNRLDTPLPPILVYIYLTVLILVSLIDNNEFNINLKQKLVYLMIFSLSFLSIFVLEYIAWNAVGGNIIEGIYGRYFIPIAPLFFLLFYNKKFKFNSNKIGIVLILFSLSILSISLYMIVKRFYIL